MILSRRVKLNDVQLDQLGEEYGFPIVIQRVDPGTTKENITAVDLMAGVGQRVTGSHFQTIDVQVTYGINIPKENLTARRAVFDLVNAWAVNGGWLMISEIPDRRVYIDKVILPSAQELRDWTAEFTITFRAYAVPFWQDAKPTQATRYGASQGSLQLQVNGNTDTVYNVKWTNISGASINSLRIYENGGSSINIMNFPPIGGSASIDITHTSKGLISVKSGSTDLYSYMTGDDDLFIRPGLHTIGFACPRAGRIELTAYGRYL